MTNEQPVDVLDEARRRRPGVELTWLSLAVATARGERSRNEDAVGVAGWTLQSDGPGVVELRITLTPGRPALVALVDGMGGHVGGDHAARIASRLLTSRPEEDAAGPLTAMVVDRLRRTDRALHDEAGDALNGMGCTAALLAVPPDGRAVVGNVGDVRAYRVVDGYVGQVTVDDRPPRTAGPDTTRVTACLGGRRRDHVLPHVHEVELRPGDRLLLCSDGLHDVLPDGAIAAGMTARATDAAAGLVASALAGGAADNVTVAVVDVGGGPRRLVGSPAHAG